MQAMLDRIDEGVCHIKTQQLVQPMETTMQKTVLTIFGALLISGLAVQMAAASEHHRSKAGRDLSNLRRAYNQVIGPIDVAPRGLDRFDSARPGGQDPDLNPSGS